MLIWSEIISSAQKFNKYLGLEVANVGMSPISKLGGFCLAVIKEVPVSEVSHWFLKPIWMILQNPLLDKNDTVGASAS